MKAPFGYNCGQMHYLRIKPSYIIAKEYLGDNLRIIIFFNGILDSCLVTSDRNLNKHTDTYDADIFSVPEWQYMDNMSRQEYVGDILKPKSLLMMDACMQKISK